MKKKVTKIVRLKNFPLLFPAKRDVKSFRVGRNIFFPLSLLPFFLSLILRSLDESKSATHEFAARIRDSRRGSVAISLLNGLVRSASFPLSASRSWLPADTCPLGPIKLNRAQLASIERIPFYPSRRIEQEIRLFETNNNSNSFFNRFLD